MTGIVWKLVNLWICKILAELELNSFYVIRTKNIVDGF